jgi:zinc transport system substrate-binding protein
MIAGADLVVWVGEALEFYLADPLRVEGVENLELVEVEGVDPHRYEGGQKHSSEVEGTARHAHDHFGLDPHLWLDPVRARRIVSAVAETLAEIDPDHAEQYRSNAEATAERLLELDAEVRAQLTPFAKIPFITFHDGYSYFVERYGLNQVGHVALNHDRQLGAATVKGLRDRIASEGVRCAFTEPQFDPDALQVLAGESDIKVGVLDALGASLKQGPDLYPALIRKNAAAIGDCLAPAS